MAKLVSAPVFLLGSMGAGKSTVGRHLASRIDAPFIDLDRRIERLFGRSIAALFESGEPRFRACEHAALRSLLAEPGFARSACVVATGGGVVEDPRNLARIAGAGRSVYLRVEIAVLVERLASPSERATRPLLAESAADSRELATRLGERLARREGAYASATWTVDAAGPPEQVAEAILAQLD